MQTVKFREETGDTPDQHLMDADAQKPLPLRYLLTRPVLVSVANYATLALLGMVSAALMPLIWSTSIEFGGLDMSPASIGVWLSVFGCMNGIFQLTIFPRAVTRFGPRSIFVTAIGVFAVVYTMFPLENLVMRRAADNGAWLVILLQLTGLSISEMGYSELLCDSFGCAQILITLISPRFHIHVSQRRRPQQAITRRDKWSRTIRGISPAHSRASRRRLALRILDRE